MWVSRRRARAPNAYEKKLSWRADNLHARLSSYMSAGPWAIVAVVPIATVAIVSCSLLLGGGGGGASDGERQPLLHRDAPLNSSSSSGRAGAVVAASGSRWAVLLLSALSAFAQGAMWNFYSPISTQLTQVYGWTDDDFAWLLNASNIVFVVVCPVWPWLIERTGLRACMLAAYALLLASGVVRCIDAGCSSSDSSSSGSAGSAWHACPQYQTQFLSMILNGIAAPFCSLMPPAVSAAWFPVEERATATAVMVTFVYFGISAGFIAGPLAIRSGSDSEIVSRLHSLFIAEAAIVAVLLGLVACCFPKRPPQPPSRSSLEQRYAFFEGMCALGKSRRFWLLLIAMTIPDGTYAAFGSVLNLNMAQFGLSGDEAAWLGCIATLAGGVVGISVGALADRFAGRMKLFILACYAGAALCFLWFALLCAGVIPRTSWQLYASYIVGGMLLNGAIPLFFELTVECTFPIAEGASAGMIMLIDNLIQVAFLIVPMDKVGKAWMNWSVVVVVVAAAGLLVPMKERYDRWNMDQAA